MKLQIIQGTDTIVTNNPDVAYLARQVLKSEFVSVEETELANGLGMNTSVNGDKFKASIVFGPRPKHVLFVTGDIGYEENNVILTIQSMEYELKTVDNVLLHNFVHPILTNHITYYHKPEIHAYFTR